MSSLAGEGLPDERGEEEHQEDNGEAVASKRGLHWLEVSEADGDVQRQTAGDHEDVEVEHRAHHESASASTAGPARRPALDSGGRALL